MENNTQPNEFKNLSDFSTDPSVQDSEYTPLLREDWLEQLESNRKKTASTSAASASLKRPEKQPTNSPVQLLDKLLTMVEPKEGKEAAVRRVTRELKTALHDQNERLKKDCPVGNIPDNIRAWSTGVAGECAECGMNHFLVELYRIAERLYGSTATERKLKIAKWLDEGTDDYVTEIRSLISTSWLGQLLADITEREKVKAKGSVFDPVKETQVNTYSFTFD